MQRLREYFSVVLTGSALIFMGANLQFHIMDLSQHSLSEYMQVNVLMPEWWRAVVFPVVLGLLLAAFGIWASYSHAMRGKGRRIYISMLFPGVAVLLFVHGFAGIFLLLGGFAGWLGLWLEGRKPNNSLKVDGADAPPP